jgi:hypothetical protein
LGHCARMSTRNSDQSGDSNAPSKRKQIEALDRYISAAALEIDREEVPRSRWRLTVVRIATVFPSS